MARTQKSTRTFGRRVCASVLIVLLPLAMTGARAVAAPRVILAYGALLPDRVVLSDWRENAEFMRGIQTSAPVAESTLVARPVVSLALFWGPPNPWDSSAVVDTASLRPERANQHAAFYPATPSQPPVIVLRGPATTRAPSDARHMSPTALTILTKHGVPVLAR